MPKELQSVNDFKLLYSTDMNGNTTSWCLISVKAKVMATCYNERSKLSALLQDMHAIAHDLLKDAKLDM